jgi:hypothetical protein
MSITARQNMQRQRLTAIARHLGTWGGAPAHQRPAVEPRCAAAAGDPAAPPLLRVGVIGGGRKGTQWARAFAVHPECEVVAIADADADNRALFAGRFALPAAAAYADYEEMLAAARLDIVAPILPVRPAPTAHGR